MERPYEAESVRTKPSPAVVEAACMSTVTGHRVQMRWRDLDALGHVNHPVVLTYLEEGRDAFLKEHGIGREEYVVGRCSVIFNV